MTNSASIQSLFHNAIRCIDAGELSMLRDLLEATPALLSTRSDTPAEGYFKHPYLLWFIAENPVRQGKMPANIVEITRLLIHFARKNAPGSFSGQLDTALGLVATSRVARESCYQILLLDELIDNGAKPGNGLAALAHGNVDAARHLVDRGGTLTLAGAVGLQDSAQVARLLQNATAEEKQVALLVAAFYGREQDIQLLLHAGTAVNEWTDSEFHTHASALHQAVSSGSLNSVKLLVNAGADLHSKDRIYGGTPLEWARYLQATPNEEQVKKTYAEIEQYLQRLLP